MTMDTDSSLYITALIVMLGVAIVGGFEWAVFRGKSHTFRKTYHPTMAMVGALGYGILFAVVITRNGATILEAIWIIPVTLAIGIVDALKRQVCTSCGHEANRYAINGFAEKYKYCPKFCGRKVVRHRADLFG